MSRPVKNVENIRNLLRQMDRSVDDARTRREGGSRVPSGSSAQTPPPVASPSPNGSMPAPATSRPVASSAVPPRPASPTQAHLPNQTYPTSGSQGAGPRPTSLPGGNGVGGPGSYGGGATSGGATPAQPQRLKAKPKRSSGDDPLQDFQQRQAS